MRCGVDLCIEAGTKYLSGSSDLLLGLVSANERCFPALRDAYDAMAICPGPEDVFLALRGLRTMHLRLKEHEKQALAVARWLETRPEVKQVLHPAARELPGPRNLEARLLGLVGPVLDRSFIRRRDMRVAAMLDDLALFGMGYSWGGFESLIVPFDCSTYRTATKWNPGGPALRFQIGLEDVDDLTADLDAGFARLRKAASSRPIWASSS